MEVWNFSKGPKEQGMHGITMKAEKWILTSEFMEWTYVIGKLVEETTDEAEDFFADWERDLQSGEMPDEV